MLKTLWWVKTSSAHEAIYGSCIRRWSLSVGMWNTSWALVSSELLWLLWLQFDEYHLESVGRDSTVNQKKILMTCASLSESSANQTRTACLRFAKKDHCIYSTPYVLLQPPQNIQVTGSLQHPLSSPPKNSCHKRQVVSWLWADLALAQSLSHVHLDDRNMFVDIGPHYFFSSKCIFPVFCVLFFFHHISKEGKHLMSLFFKHALTCGLLLSSVITMLTGAN